MRSISVAERRHRLGVRHRLAPSARVDDDIAAVARSVVVLHATDPATVLLSALARMAHPDPAIVERALYEDRTVLRMLGMRRTLFTVPVELAPIVHASSTLAVAAVERRKLEAMLERGGIPAPVAPWLARVEAATLAAMDELGEAATTSEVAPLVPELATKLQVGEGTRYAATVGLSSRVLFLLAADGHLVRGRPKGRWTGSQHRWATTRRWLGAPLAEVDPAQARVDLARRWLERFGPATVADLKWWTGWTLGAVRTALASLDAVEVDLDGTPGLVLRGDEEPSLTPGSSEPWVALLPGLDPTTMGWTARDWYLGSHRSQVFDRSGNAGPTVWVDGRIVGGWAMRRDGELVTALLEDIGRERTAEVDEAAARLQASLGEIRVTPRFPAPLDKGLAR